MKRNLHIVSPTGSSIGEISIDLIKYLSNEFEVTKEWKIDTLDESKRDILLVHFLDFKISMNPIFKTFKYKVLIQPIDGTELIREAVDEINRYDLIICPAKASKHIMRSNGISTKIEIIPNYYKTGLLDLHMDTPIKKHIPQDKIILYHESTFHPRKGIDLLYEAYIKAFSDTEYANKVLLVLKDMPYNSLTFARIEKLKKESIKLQKQYKSPAPIIKFSTFLSSDDLEYLWKSTSIYVSMAKIEGFGIPLLRMCLLNKPIVCLENNLSGYMDYLNNENSYLIPSQEVRAENEHMWLYTEDSTWNVAKIDDIVNVLRLAVKEYMKGTHKKITKQQYKEYLHKYNLFIVAQQYIDQLKKLC